MNRLVSICLIALTCTTASVCSTAPAQESPLAVAVEGTPKVDGKVEAAWHDVPKVQVKKPVPGLLVIEEDKMATATVQFMWDDQHIYALWRVKDAALSAEADDAWAQDSVELFLDQNKKGTPYYQSDDGQYRVNFKGDLSGQGEGYDEADLKAATAKSEDGYIVEMSVLASKVELKKGVKLGLELQVNDDHDSGSRDAVAKWNHTADDSWEDTSNFGTLELQ